LLRLYVSIYQCTLLYGEGGGRMTKKYTYKEFIDTFSPNSKCPSCDNAVPIRRTIRGEVWRICPSCDWIELDKCQFDYKIEKDKDV